MIPRRTFLQLLGLAPAIPIAARLPALGPVGGAPDLDAIFAALYEVKRNRDKSVSTWKWIPPDPSRHIVIHNF